MSTPDLKEFGKTFTEDYSRPTVLFHEGGHRVFWLGVPEATAFRCNTYLITDNDEAVIIDPGGTGHFGFVLDRVSQILPPERVVAQILSHQDPDVAASFPFWAEINPAIKVIASGKTLSKLSYIRDFRYDSLNINDLPEFRFTSGKSLQFIESPFLHSPGAFTTFDKGSCFLFSGDIWAAVDMEWTLIVEDLSKHILKLNLFHIDSMSGNKAARGFINRLRGFPIEAILPQHGSIIPAEFVPGALKYMEQLNCGADIIYPDLK